MNKKLLNRVFLLSAAGLLTLVIILGAVQLKNRVEPQIPVVIQQAEVDIVSILTAPATPSPTPENRAPAGAVTLLVDRVPVLTLNSRNEAENLLSAYLAQCATAPEGETFVSATFDKELILVNAAPDAIAADYFDALTLLTNAPGTVPVRLTTLRKEQASAPIEKTESKDPALPKGSRIIVQLGAGAVTETTRQITYVAGAETAAGEPDSTPLQEGRNTILKVGAFAARDTAGEPEEKEGEQGKSQGSLKLSWPMRGNVVSRFGWRNGNIHSGVDIENSAGTAVTAPGEGVVTYCGERGAYGFVVDVDHGNGFVSRLTHLTGVTLALNQRVFAGEAVGALSAPDEADKGKPHLHYELIVDGVPYNPEFYIG